MPGLQPVAFVHWARAHYPATEVLPLTAHDRDCYLAGMLEAGAVGYLLKDEAPGTIVAAVRGVARGEEGWLSRQVAEKVMRRMREGTEEICPLTERELDILRLLAKGWTNARIARELAVSERTVKCHGENLVDKLGVGNRTEAVVEGIRRGWLEV